MAMKEIIVINSYGERELFDRAKLRCHLESLAEMENLSDEYIDIAIAVEKIIAGLPDVIQIDELIDLISETIASLTTVYYEYSFLASKVLSCHLQKQLPHSFSQNIEYISSYTFPNTDTKQKLVLSEKLIDVAKKYSELIDSAIKPERDYTIDYFGFKTLQRSYLLRLDGKIVETPQFLFMRVALGIHYENIANAIETYELMSRKYFIHASPTLFNAGLEKPNLSSCYLVAMKDDSLDGIYKTLYDTAMISKASGGVGLHVSNIRAAGAYISGSNGISSGLVPMLKVFNSTAQYVDQGGNKRPGAFCIYLEPWHADIFRFLDLRKNHGKEEMRARDLFLGLWIPDLFMKKVENDEDWCLFSPDTSPGLSDCVGLEFKALYEAYEKEGRYMEKIKARKLWNAILVSQTETGNPFLLYKDRCNALSNQQNLGIIKSSNLCCEIIQYSSQNETAVCNLASLALPSYVKDGIFNFQKLHDITKVVIRNLDRVIDVNEYPLDNCKVSNSRHRPVGLGVQGLADVFFLLKMPFGSAESRKLNIQIFETIYHAALEQSCQLALEKNRYNSYDGSPVSKNKLQFDLWKVVPTDLWNWDDLRLQIKKHGLRNSLLVALMPTASSSQILGFNECFEPVTSNIYIRRVLSGEHQVVNKYLVDDLTKLNLWTKDLKDLIIANDGSIQTIDCIPSHIKELYKTVWEISQKIIIDMAADRGPFVDQSQSMNLFLEDVTFSKLTSMHFYAWKKGLKTGMYYLRTRAASSAIKFSLDASKVNIVQGNTKRLRRYSDTLPQDDPQNKKEVPTSSNDAKKHQPYNIFDDSIIICSLDDPENCDSCSA